MKQVIELLQEKLNESNKQIADTKDILSLWDGTALAKELQTGCNNLKQFANELQQALNILSDSSAKICPDVEQLPTEVEPNNSADAPKV